MTLGLEMMGKSDHWLNKTPRPLFASSVSCGFPSPADDHCEEKLDLNDLLVRHPSATFFLRAQGDSMKNAGISSGDMLIVDRSISPKNGTIVVAVINSELTVKRLRTKGKRVFLTPENDDYPEIELKRENQVHFWGVVSYVIHAV